MAKPSLARDVTFLRNELLIDGESFPWHFMDLDVRYTPDSGEWPSKLVITIPFDGTLIADKRP